LKLYGPFKIEDVATLPMENAEIFIKRGIAEQVRLK
jgi:DNA replication initiation complex subunit (GINS family)